MKGNKKIGITAEAVALMKAERNVDPYSKYFVTPRVRFSVGLSRLIVPKTVERVFSKRIELSEDIAGIVKKYKPEQIIDLGSGGSTFVFDYAIKHPKVNCIEIDMREIVKWKRSILEEIKKVENLGEVSNFHVEACDLLQEDIYGAIKPHFKTGKKTLIMSIGVNSYFDHAQYDVLFDKLEKFMEKTGAEYLSHESLSEQRKELMTGFGGKVLRGFVRVLARSKSHAHFVSEKEFKDYFTEKKFEIEIVKRRPENLIYFLRAR